MYNLFVIWDIYVQPCNGTSTTQQKRGSKFDFKHAFKIGKTPSPRTLEQVKEKVLQSQNIFCTL